MNWLLARVVISIKGRVVGKNEYIQDRLRLRQYSLITNGTRTTGLEAASSYFMH